MRKRRLRFGRIFFIMFLFSLIGGFGYWYVASAHDRAEKQKHNEEVAKVLEDRITIPEEGEEADPFGDDDLVRVLFIGLDSRAGDPSAHCDAIQMIEIDKAQEHVTITAVPRGTYSPLPPGKGTTSSDYYVSNACGLAGIDYGVEQMERILGKKADYLVFAGFSEVLGMFRALKLPTTETLQWLRNRQGYSIGEPQRARNHSNFLKKLLIERTQENQTTFDTALHYLLYTIVNTDLSFAEVESIFGALAEMDLKDNPDRISLDMRPAHDVQNIEYDPEHIREHLDATLGKIAGRLPRVDYSNASKEEIQEQLLKTISEQKDNPEFVQWSFDNHVWLQVEDPEVREKIHFDTLVAYVESLEDREQQIRHVEDYILEMNYWGEEYWTDMGWVFLDRLNEQNTGSASTTENGEVL